MSSRGGPLPPRSVWIVAPAVWIFRLSNPGNNGEDWPAAWLNIASDADAVTLSAKNRRRSCFTNASGTILYIPAIEAASAPQNCSARGARPPIYLPHAGLFNAIAFGGRRPGNRSLHIDRRRSG